MTKKIKFYRYYFQGLPKPITMETYDKDTADRMLNSLNQKSNNSIDMSKLIDFRVEHPIVGISEKTVGGFRMVWVGKDKTADGWVSKQEFNSSIV